MRTRRAVGGKRLLAVCAGFVLVGGIGAGPAWAADGDGSGTTSGSTTSSSSTTDSGGGSGTTGSGTTSGDTSTTGGSSSSTTGDTSTTGDSASGGVVSVPPSVSAPAARVAAPQLTSSDAAAGLSADAVSSCASQIADVNSAQDIITGLGSGGTPTAEQTAALTKAQNALATCATLAGTPSAGTTPVSAACTALIGQLGTAQGQLAAALNAINALPVGTMIPPALTTARDNAIKQITTIQGQLTALGCSLIPDTTTGGGNTTNTTNTTNVNTTSAYDPCFDNGYTNLNYCTTDAYDSGFNNGFNRGVNAASTPATGTATQVSSVPTGGVNTGDGSF